MNIGSYISSQKVTLEYMRACKPFANPSNNDEISERQKAYALSASVTDFISLESAMIRSNDENLVQQGLDSALAKIRDIGESERRQIEFLIVLAFFRLHRDDELIERVKNVEKDGVSSDEILSIAKALQREKQTEKMTGIAKTAGVLTTTAVCAVAVLAGVVLFRRKK